MRDRILIRKMTATDAEGVYRMSSAALPASAEEREHVRGRSAEDVGELGTPTPYLRSGPFL
jgi:hypothetical protein